MLCPRCGAELFPGMAQCPECGGSVQANAYRSASVTVSGREARQGVFKTLNLPQMTGPVRFRVKPGTRNGTQIIVNNAVFVTPDGGTVLIPVRVTVCVKKGPEVLLVPLLAALLLVSLGLGVQRIVAALMGSGSGTPQTQMQVLSTQPPVRSPETQPPQSSETLPAVPVATEPAVTEPAATEPPGIEPDSSILYFDQRPLLHQLSEELLTNLEAIYEAAMEFETTVEFPCEMTPEELGYLTTLMHSEFPELMQLDNTVSTSYSYDEDGYVTSYDLPFVLTEAEYERRYDLCTAAIDTLVAQTEGLTDWEKERYVFDYITETCTYNMDAEAANTPYGVLVNRVAKCDGISLSMKWIMEEMGITCLCITGDPTVGDIGHAWNMIELDGAYYNVDVTMDVREAGDECPTLYCALNVTNEIVLQDYVLSPVFTELLEIPQVTTMEKSHHVQNGSYVTAGADWSAAISECFLAAYETGAGQLLQFESQADFEACLQGTDVRINELFQEKSLSSCRWQTWRNDEFLVLCILVYF